MYEQVNNSDSGSSVVTEDNHRFTAQYDYFYSHQLYFTLPSYDLLLDELKNIKYQTSLGVAVGYEVIDITGLDINVYAGPSAQHTEFVNVEAGADDKVFSPALAFGLDFEYDITSDLEYFLVYDAKVVNKESGRFIQRFETGFDIEIVDDFDLELMTIIDNTAEPIADENGVQPKATDVVFTVGIEYEF
jgi:hypothetical protein